MKSLIILLSVSALVIIVSFFAWSLRDGNTVVEVPDNPLKVVLFEEVEVGRESNFFLESSDRELEARVFDGVKFALLPSPYPPVAGEEALLTFNLMVDGEPATNMETHMGVYGKGVAIHKDTLEVVPVSIVKRPTPHGTLEFRTTFPHGGEYLVLTQFKRAGRIITTHFSVSSI